MPKLILAPMVRVGTLPMRILALKYGADIVFTEEIIDKKLVNCNRIWNPNTKSVEFRTKDDVLVFSTDPTIEKEKLVLQLGSSNPEIALKAAQLVQNDVSRIDLNCGCPKAFSLKGGMGSALLKDPKLLCSILKNLTDHLTIPVSCKIRVFSNLNDTLDLITKILNTGICSLAVHLRTPSETYETKARYDYIEPIYQHIQQVNTKHQKNVELVINGDLFSQKDIETLNINYPDVGLMLASAAQNNPSIFKKEGVLPIKEVALEYLKLAVQYEMPYQNTKFVLMTMLSQRTLPELYLLLAKCKSRKSICEAFGIEDKTDEQSNDIHDFMFPNYYKFS